LDTKSSIASSSRRSPSAFTRFALIRVFIPL
jgi:hypothetical protein